ncbi:MAG TPA: hypothetical protein VF132_00600, partial [Rudaea sp.]
MLRKVFVLAALPMLASRLAVADPPAIAAIGYSADTGANLIDANTFVARKDVVLDALGTARLRLQINGLPDNVNLRDFHIESGVHGDWLLALDVGVALNGIYFRPGDVIRYDGSTFSKEFDASAAGVPAGV